MKNKNPLILLAATLITVGLIVILLSFSGIFVVKQDPTVPQEFPQTQEENSASESAQVTRVVDGDTIEVKTSQGTFKVRYIGIDTPETVDPRRAVGCFGHEASQENKRLVEGKIVYLEKDISETDKYGRLLRFVYLPTEKETIFINDYLVRQGYAKVSTFPPDVKFATEFLEVQREAQLYKRGLWQKCQ